MKKEDCFELGVISRTHGLNGEVIFNLDVDSPSNYEEMDTVFMEEQGQLVPLFIESISANKNRFIVALEDIETVEEAEKLKGAKLYLPLEVLPELEEGQFYYHDIIDYTIIDQNLGELGHVATIYANTNSQDLLAMKYKGKEVLIPMAEDIVIRANHETKTMEVNLPEGLLDIYLED
ncbi:ribosome maturation factor RimM [Algivirga pacifica]|uniref:Ribosome maturation factor RimM n=1 Tax=Algivirga pacifica TaxID=1162670 RepID=A0ABP9D3M7_9BACT